MKKKVMKTMVAAVCVVAAGMGGLRVYNAANLSEADMLFAENVEALSQNEYGPVQPDCHPRPGVCFWEEAYSNPHDGQRFGGPGWE